jgi:hypothetical protein
MVHHTYKCRVWNTFWGVFKASVTRRQSVLICGFFGQNAVSQISSHCLTDFFCYEEINVVH